MGIIEWIKKLMGIKDTKPVLEIPQIENFVKDEVNTTHVLNIVEQIQSINEKVEALTYPLYLIGECSKKMLYEENIERNDKKGLLEDYFFDFIESHLDYDVRNDVKINTVEGSFTPDFCIISEKLVIEIDEPYSNSVDNERIPIHYIGYDDSRNNKLLKAGWRVLRFAEFQIAKYPIDCCNYISDLLSNKIGTIETLPCWSDLDSENMILSDFRNTYLPIEFKGLNFNTNSEYSYRSFLIDFCEEKTEEKIEKSKVRIVFIKTQNNNNRLQQINDCWIPTTVFVENLKKTKLYEEIRKRWGGNKKMMRFIIWDTLSRTNIRDMFTNRIRFEGYGKQHQKHFNLRDWSKYEMIISEEDILSFCEKWDSLIKQQSKKNSIK